MGSHKAYWTISSFSFLIWLLGNSNVHTWLAPIVLLDSAVVKAATVAARDGATSPAEPLQGFPSIPPGRRSEPHQQGTVLPPEGGSPVKALPARPRPSPHLPDSQVSRGPTPPVGAAVSPSSFPSLVTAATFPSAGKDQGCFRDFQSLQTRMIL